MIADHAKCRTLLKKTVPIFAPARADGSETSLACSVTQPVTALSAGTMPDQSVGRSVGRAPPDRGSKWLAAQRRESRRRQPGADGSTMTKGDLPCFTPLAL